VQQETEKSCKSYGSLGWPIGRNVGIQTWDQTGFVILKFIENKFLKIFTSLTIQCSK